MYLIWRYAGILKVVNQWLVFEKPYSKEVISQNQSCSLTCFICIKHPMCSETPSLGQKTAQGAWNSLSAKKAQKLLMTTKDMDQLEGAPIDQKWEFLNIIKHKDSKWNISKTFKTTSSWQKTTINYFCRLPGYQLILKLDKRSSSSKKNSN